MKQTFIITTETTQKELVAHCVNNHTLGSPFFGVVREYNLTDWTWLKYRGFTIEVHWNNNRIMVPCSYSPNDPTWHKYKKSPTRSTKVDDANKPYFLVELPYFSGMGRKYDSGNINDIRRIIDSVIKTGEEFYGWTETDRTTHMIKR